MKDTMEMAREAGIRDCTCNGEFGCLERFAAIVSAAEREAIYDIMMMAPWKECGHDQDEFDSEVGTAMKAMAFSITAAIRARGNK